MPKGPQPTPKEELKARGSWRARHREDDLELDGLPRPPTNLRGEALAEWKRLVPLYEGKGVLSAGDRASLATMCRAWAHLDDYERRLNEAHGDIDEEAKVHKEVQQAFTRWFRLAQCFGLTPADRARVKMPGTGTKTGTKAKFFKPRVAS